MNMGYTTSSSGSGALAVAPRENHFGQEFVVNQLAVVLERELDPDRLSFGFKAIYWTGADPALIQPLGGIDSPPGNPRFGQDFRELAVTAHLPILTDGGVDLKLGRQNSVIGFESAMAPYRPFYSNAYQWFYSEDGAFTGLVGTWHVYSQLDLVSGITMGGNTFFTYRENGPAYLGQLNYWLTDEKKTLFSSAVYAGPGSILAFTPNLEGDFETMVEVRVQHQWNDYFTQIVQNNMGWANGLPGGGTGEWYGVYTIGIMNMLPKLDLNLRAEWFNDVQGTRTGVASSYEEVTIGLNFMPPPCLNFRPEIRGDFSSDPAFGTASTGLTTRQLTVGLEALMKF